MKTVQNEKRTGVVVFLPSNIGSKSEAIIPHLYQSKEAPLVRLLMKDDNPFENKGMSEYDGVRVTVEGLISASGAFVVESIKRCPVVEN